MANNSLTLATIRFCSVSGGSGIGNDEIVVTPRCDKATPRLIDASIVCVEAAQRLTAKKSGDTNFNNGLVIITSIAPYPLYVFGTTQQLPAFPDLAIKTSP